MKTEQVKRTIPKSYKFSTNSKAFQDLLFFMALQGIWREKRRYDKRRGVPSSLYLRMPGKKDETSNT